MGDKMEHDGRISRRRMLQYGGSLGATALAGCSGLANFTTDQQAVDTVSFNEGNLIVNLNPDIDVDTIEFRGPSDQLLRTAQATRKHQVSIPLIIVPTDPPNPPSYEKPLPSGDYGLVATKSSGENGDPKTISEQTVELTSSFSVADVSVLKNDPRSGFGNNNAPSYAEEFKVTVKNEGNLPLGIKYIGVTDGVPSPIPPPQQALQGAISTSVFELGARDNSTGPYYIENNSTLAFKTTVSPLSYYAYWRNPKAGDSPGPHTWGAPESGASWETIKKNYCTGKTHPATIVVAPMNLEAQKITATLRWGGKATYRHRLDTSYACTDVTVTNIKGGNSSK